MLKKGIIIGWGMLLLITNFAIASELALVVEDVYSYYGDGYVINSNSSWGGCRGDESGISFAHTEQEIIIGSEHVAKFQIYRGFLVFDIKLPDNAKVHSANLNLYCVKKQMESPDSLVIVKSNQESDKSLTFNDFKRCGSIDYPREGAKRIDMNLMTDEYTIIPMNASGISWIKNDIVLQLGLRTARDIDNIFPENEKLSNITIGSSALEGKKPYIRLTYTCRVSDAPKTGGNVLSVIRLGNADFNNDGVVTIEDYQKKQTEILSEYNKKQADILADYTKKQVDLIKKNQNDMQMLDLWLKYSVMPRIQKK